MYTSLTSGSLSPAISSSPVILSASLQGTSIRRSPTNRSVIRSIWRNWYRLPIWCRKRLWMLPTQMLRNRIPVRGLCRVIFWFWVVGVLRISPLWLVRPSRRSSSQSPKMIWKRNLLKAISSKISSSVEPKSFKSINITSKTNSNTSWILPISKRPSPNHLLMGVLEW